MSLYDLKTANESGAFGIDFSVVVGAAKNGHLDCLKYAVEDHLQIGNTFGACIAAASNGHLDCMQYALDKVYDVYDKTTRPDY